MNSFVADDNKPYTSCQGRISILGFSKKSKQIKKKQKKKTIQFPIVSCNIFLYKLSVRLFLS